MGDRSFTAETVDLGLRGKLNFRNETLILGVAALDGLKVWMASR